MYQPIHLFSFLYLIAHYPFLILLYPYMALFPSSSSMRSSWLYLAMRSERLKEPVLICPLLVATAMSAMVESSVSPERCEVTVVYPWRCAISMAFRVSVREPIWFTLMSMEFAHPFSMPMARKSTLVTNRSSPTNWQRFPMRSVSFFQPSQSFSLIPSSIESIGYLLISSSR